MLAIFVVFLLSVSAVCADENLTDDSIVENAQEDAAVNATQTVGTFTQLSNSIKSTDEGYMLHLSRDYENDGRWNYINIDKRMGIDGEGHSIDAKSSSRVFRVTASYVLLKNITFVNGKYDNFYGGAIYLASNSNLEIRDCRFINCTSELGGAIYCSDSSRLDISNSSFIKCSSDSGGAIYCSDSSNLTISNSNFISCSSDSGGAIYCEDFSRLYISNSSFINCSAQFGGAVYYMSNVVGTIYDSTFTGNVAEVVGGSLFSGGGTIRIERSNFTNGRAIYESGGAFTFIDTTFIGHYLGIFDCESEFGGAVTLLSSRTNMTHSTFRKNSAKYDGGALYASYGLLYLEDNVLSQNTASRGGAVFLNMITAKVSGNVLEDNSALKANAIYALTLNDLADFTSDNYAPSQSDFINAINDNLTITGDDYYQFEYRQENLTSLPSYYSMVDERLLTPVKDQGTEGNCWAFAAMASLESCILKASGMALDLSEANLKNLMALFSNYGYNVAVNDGGHAEMAYGYLASWLGPVFETDDSYYINDYLSPLLKSILHIQNVIILKRNDFTDNDAIKDAVIRYGAVATSMFYDDEYIKNETSYYSNTDYATNHAVCIVGWDDSYSRYNFNITPPGDGAWIVRNSWGPDWGDDGYFYVSYYDTKFAEIDSQKSYTFILNDTIHLDRVYQLEIQKTSSFYFQQDKIAYKNVFTVEGNEYLAAVSTIFLDECDFNVYVYVNDVLKATKSGKAREGYYTVNLDVFIYLNPNDRVDVAFNCTNFKGGVGLLPFSSITNCTDLYIQSGNSYYWNNLRWIDLYDSGVVACIKMFTTFTNDHRISPYLELDLDIDTGDGAYIIDVVCPQDAVGIVSITHNSSEYVINLSDERSIKLFDLADGDVIFARYGGDAKYSEKTFSLVVDTNISRIGTFEDLLNKIRMTKEGGLLRLTKDYANLKSDDEITIKKAITIDGQGHTISAKALSRIFNVLSDSVVLKNINFADGYSEGNASAVMISGIDCSVINCTFKDSYSKDGAALYWSAGNALIMDCLFTNNSASDSSQSAAIFLSTITARISNSTFTNNSAYIGSAVTVYSYMAIIDGCTFTYNHASSGAAIASLGSVLKITNSTFKNNDATSIGGALYLIQADCEISGCSFSGNNAKNAGAILLQLSNAEFVNSSFEANGAAGSGGAVFSMNGTGIYDNCSFKDNCAGDGGAIISTNSNDKLTGCSFSQNVASDLGGAVCLASESGIIDMCLFESNSASSGGAVLWQCKAGNVVNSVFINNSASGFGGAVLWYAGGSMSNSHFKSNTADMYGGAVYWYGNDGYLSNSTFEDNPNAVIWTGDNGELADSTFINNINATQIIWSVTHSGEIHGCRFINSTRDNILNNGAHFTRRNADPTANDTTVIFKHPESVSLALNGVLDDLPITSDFIFTLTQGGESKTYHLNTTTLFDELVDLEIGNWTVNVVFEGDDNYYAFERQFTLTVNPADSFTLINDTNALSGHEAELTAYVYDVNRQAIDEGSVSFFDGSEKIGSSDVIGGVARLAFTPLAGGEHEITAVYYSEHYLSSNATAKLVVDSVTLRVTLKNGTVGFNSTFVADVTGLYSTVNEGTVTFYIDDEYMAEVSVSNGTASVIYVPKIAGNHVVRAAFCYESNFTDAEDSSQYHVDRADSAVSIDDVNATVGHNVTLTALVTSSNNASISDGTVTFRDANNIIGTADVKNGVATLTYTPQADGEHIITATYESDNYIGSSDDAKLLVDSISLEVIADPGTVGFNSTFTVNVKGLYSTVNEGIVTFYVDDEFVSSVSVSGGVSSVIYVPTKAGSHVVRAVYSQSPHFSDDFSTASYEVKKADSAVTIASVNGTVDHALTLTAYVTSSNGVSINEGTVTFRDANKVIGTVNVENGVATLAYTPTADGEHTITAVFECDNYVKSNSSAKSYVDSISLEVISSSGTVGYKSAFTVNVRGLYSTVNEGTVTFYLDGNQIGKEILTDGVAALTYTPMKAGSNTLKVIYAESSRFSNKEYSTSYSVEKATSQVLISNLKGTVGNALTIRVNVASPNGQSISEGTVTFMDNGKVIASANVNAGTAGISYTPQTAGDHQISAQFNADNYQSSQNSSTLSVDRAKTQVIVDNVANVYYGSPSAFSITVISNGEAVGEGYLRVYVNGEEIRYIALENGKVTFDYTSAGAGTFEAEAVFQQSDNYLTSLAKTTFTVNKLPTEITSYDVYTVYNTGSEIVATLKDLNGRPMAGFAVSVNSNNLITDSNGQVRLSTNSFNPGTYALSATFEGNTNYAKSSRVVTLTVAKATPKLKASKKTFKAKAKTKKYTVTLRTHQNLPLANAQLKIKVNGKTFKATSNAKGKATFKIKKLTKRGTFKSTVTFNGDVRFNKVTKKVKITVK